MKVFVGIQIRPPISAVLFIPSSFLPVFCRASDIISALHLLTCLSIAVVLYLVGCPHSGGLRHPLPGVDSCVDPDGGALVATGAELDATTTEGSVMKYQSRQSCFISHAVLCKARLTLSTYMGLFSYDLPISCLVTRFGYWATRVSIQL